jgi:hypothetical protein
LAGRFIRARPILHIAMRSNNIALATEHRWSVLFCLVCDGRLKPSADLWTFGVAYRAGVSRARPEFSCSGRCNADKEFVPCSDHSKRHSRCIPRKQGLFLRSCHHQRGRREEERQVGRQGAPFVPSTSGHLSGYVPKEALPSHGKPCASCIRSRRQMHPRRDVRRQARYGDVMVHTIAPRFATCQRIQWASIPSAIKLSNNARLSPSPRYLKPELQCEADCPEDALRPPRGPSKFTGIFDLRGHLRQSPGAAVLKLAGHHSPPLAESTSAFATPATNPKSVTNGPPEE